jgi:hypothetical protein
MKKKVILVHLAVVFSCTTFASWDFVEKLKSFGISTADLLRGNYNKILKNYRFFKEEYNFRKQTSDISIKIESNIEKLSAPLKSDLIGWHWTPKESSTHYPVVYKSGPLFNLFVLGYSRVPIEKGAGNGLYIAGDIFSSIRYGGENPVLYKVIVHKGSLLFDPASLPKFKKKSDLVAQAANYSPNVIYKFRDIKNFNHDWYVIKLNKPNAFSMIKMSYNDILKEIPMRNIQDYHNIFSYPKVFKRIHDALEYVDLSMDPLLQKKYQMMRKIFSYHVKKSFALPDGQMGEMDEVLKKILRDSHKLLPPEGYKEYAQKTILKMMNYWTPETLLLFIRNYMQRSYFFRFYSDKDYFNDLLEANSSLWLTMMTKYKADLEDFAYSKKIGVFHYDALYKLLPVSFTEKLPRPLPYRP